MKCVIVCSLWFALFHHQESEHVAASYEATENPLYTMAWDDLSEPLNLTPYIRRNMLAEARQASLVNIPWMNQTSHSGFLQVNETYDSNLFFWFYPALKDPENAPVVLWLQGGPGSPSTYSVFVDNGPYTVTNNMEIKPQKYSWAEPFNMLFIDNPVGAGFSYTSSPDGHARSTDRIAHELHVALKQFFTIFDQYADNKFFITGLSYAGKYIPTLAHLIHRRNRYAEKQIKLSGIAIGNGFIDPETMMNYGDYLYTIGLIDDKERVVYKQYEDAIVKHIQQEEFLEAFHVFDEMLNGDFYPYQTYFKNTTGLVDYFSFADSEEVDAMSAHTQYLKHPRVREGLHVGKLNYSTIPYPIEEYLIEDFMTSSKGCLEKLLDNDYRVLLYNGQMDIIVPPFTTLNMIKHLKWKYAHEFHDTKKIIWKHHFYHDAVGYAKNVRNFYFVIVRKASHSAIVDRRVVMYDMITKFVFEKSFENREDEFINVYIDTEDYNNVCCSIP